MTTETEFRLSLYEELVLLALRDDQGTFAGGFLEQGLAGAILAELLLDGRIAVEVSRKKLVNPQDPGPVGDPILEEAMQKITDAKRRASLQTWISRLAGLKDLRHRVARRLCERGILRADEKTVLLLFTRRIYPEVNPRPEEEIIDRLRRAIFTEDKPIDPRTAVLVALAHGAEVLGGTFGRKEIRGRKRRIKQITDGDLIGKATHEVVEACQAAAAIAVMMPAMSASVAYN